MSENFDHFPKEIFIKILNAKLPPFYSDYFYLNKRIYFE